KEAAVAGIRPPIRGRRADLELFATHVREPARDLEGPVALLGDYGANPDRPLLSKERRPASVDPGEILVELGRAVMRRHFPPSHVLLTADVVQEHVPPVAHIRRPAPEIAA